MKKLTLLAMAVGAVVAFAVPASAFATISANIEEGGMFTAKSTNLKTATASGTLECETVTIEGETTSDTTEVEEIETETPTTIADNAGGANCSTSSSGVTAQITPSVEKLVFKPTTAAAQATFVAHLFFFGIPIGTCHYTGVVSLSYNHGKEITGANAAVVTGEKQLEQTLEGCPTNEKGAKATMSGSFSVTTATGGEGEAAVVTTP